MIVEMLVAMIVAMIVVMILAMIVAMIVNHSGPLLSLNNSAHIFRCGIFFGTKRQLISYPNGINHDTD